MAEGAPPIYRRDRRRLPAPERRRQIIDVATRLIADRGFWGVSMQDVADGCGLTVPGLLRHVESKVGLLIAVLEHRDVEDALSLRAHLGATEEEMPLDWATGYPAGVGLRRLCDATVRRNAIQPEIVRLFTVLAAESLEPAPAGGDRRLRRAGRTADRSARGAGRTDRRDDGRPADPMAAQPGDHRPGAGVESRCRSPVRPVHRGSAILTMQAKRLRPYAPGPSSDNSACIRIQDIGNLVADGEREVDACSGARSAPVFVFSQLRAFSQSTDWNAAAGRRPAAGRHKLITTTVDLYGHLSLLASACGLPLSRTVSSRSTSRASYGGSRTRCYVG
jgi:AcrR family transcriptional regulator